MPLFAISYPSIPTVGKLTDKKGRNQTEMWRLKGICSLLDNRKKITSLSEGWGATNLQIIQVDRLKRKGWPLEGII